MDVISKDGTRLDVLVEGPEDGPIVVLFHGVSSSRRTYDWLPQSLLRGRRVVRPDFRGHGASDWTPGRYNVDTYFEDAVAVLEQAAGRPAAVVGFSLGGCMAWRIAQERPDLAVAVMMEDAPIYYSDRAIHDAAGISAILRQSVEQENAWTEAGLSEEEAAADLALTQVAAGRTFAETLLPDGLKALAASMLVRDRGVTESAIDLQMLDGLDIRSPLGCPALLIAGHEDFGGSFHTEHDAWLAATHPEVSVVRVPRVGHQVSNSIAGRDAYLTVLTGFLERYAAVRRG